MRGEAAPRSIGPYRVLGIIGEGGMGVVYRAEHEVTHEQVALKTVRIPHESHLAGIRREIHALGRIRHPGVVRIVAEGVEGNIPWYAMELLEGRTLADVIRATWRLAPRVHAEAALTLDADDEDAQPDEPTAVASFGTSAGTDTSPSLDVTQQRAP